MNQFKMRVAGYTVQVEHLYAAVKDCCRDYLVEQDEPVDIVVKMEQSTIAYERKRSIWNARGEGKEIVAYPDDVYEIAAVNRLIAEKLICFGVLLMHGSAVAVDHSAYIFSAKSGTGKSTHVAYWKEILKDEAVIVNDDKPFLRVSDDDVWVYGSPWCGKEGRNTNVCVSLRSICFLKQGKQNWIEEISFEEALPSLMSQIYRPQNPALMAKTMERIGALKDRVSFYRLECLPEVEAAALAYETLCEGNVKGFEVQ